jgi:hypothetical protein
MLDKAFGELNFDAGWYKNATISFIGKQHEIYICASSYRETDLPTDSQQKAYIDFENNKQQFEEEIENLLIAYNGEESLNQLTPKGIVFERDGKYAVLFDDATDPDNGIAVTLAPKKEVMTQDDYL